MFHSIASGIGKFISKEPHGLLLLDNQSSFQQAAAVNRICNVMPLQERKELLKGSYKDRHYNAGSLLLGFGVFESVGGGVNTWFRTGKLFPGPHLFAGAGNLF